MGLSSRFKRDNNDKKENFESNVDGVLKPINLDEVVSIPYYGSLEELAAHHNALDSRDDIYQYIEDDAVTKIVISGKCAKIYRDDKYSEAVKLINFPEKFLKCGSPVFKYVSDNLIISGIKPPFSDEICLTIEKIQVMPLGVLAQKLDMPEKLYSFLDKSVKVGKNILVASDKYLSMMNSFAAYWLNDAVVIQDLPAILPNKNITCFKVQDLNDEDFSLALNIALNLYQNYLLVDIKKENRLGELITRTSDLKGKIFALQAANAHSALYKTLNMIMNTEHCNEKIAKSKLLHSFDYILDDNSLFVISPAKTAVITLKELPV